MNYLTSNKMVVVVLAAIVIVFAGVDAFDLQNQTYTGLSTNPMNVVTRVRTGSPAEAAGFKSGDRILKNGGISVTDSKALSRRARPAVGESREYVVDRSGQEQTLSLTFAREPQRQMLLGASSIVIGLCFLIFCLWPYFKHQNQATELLAAVGLCFGLFTIGPPYFDSYVIRTLFSILFLPLVIFGFAALLHFVLAFPKSKNWLERSNSLAVLYAPPLLLTAYIIFLIVMQPDATSTLNKVNQLLFGLFIIAYFGLSIIAMMHTFLKASAQERTEHGLNFMALGVFLALIFPVVSVAAGIVSPNTALPGSDFYGLAFILLPLSFGFAVLRSQNSGKGPETPDGSAVHPESAVSAPAEPEGAAESETPSAQAEDHEG